MRAPPNKALQLTSNSAFQLGFGSLLASTAGARSASEALLAAAERLIRWAALAESKRSKRMGSIANTLLAFALGYLAAGWVSEWNRDAPDPGPPPYFAVGVETSSQTQGGSPVAESVLTYVVSVKATPANNGGDHMGHFAIELPISAFPAKPVIESTSRNVADWAHSIEKSDDNEHWLVQFDGRTSTRMVPTGESATFRARVFHPEPLDGVAHQYFANTSGNRTVVGTATW